MISKKIFNKIIIVALCSFSCYQILCYDPELRQIDNNGLGNKLVETVEKRDIKILTYYIEYRKPLLNPEEMENTLYALDLLCLDHEDALEQNEKNYSPYALAAKKGKIRLFKADIAQILSTIVEE